jgi:hypothetical protein
MSRNGLKVWLLVVEIALSLYLGFSAARAQSTSQQSPAPAATPSRLAEEQFKNIQVLKGIPADQVVPSMQFISASLGVECEYCHVHGAMEKDDKKPKVTARKMITMMMAINKDNFEGRRDVTCFSCHRGTKEPVGTPIIRDEEAKPDNDEGKKSDEGNPALPPADQLLDKYLAALGGTDALQKISTRVQKGTVTAFGGEQFPMEIYSKGPDRRVSIMHLKGGDSVTGFDGKQGWLGVPGRTHLMSAAENAAARVDADLYFAAHLKTMFQKFTVDAGKKIDGHSTYLVSCQNEGLPPLQLYFDRQSGLLLRLVRYAETPLGRNLTQIDYADYRDAGGVKVPFRWTLARPDNRFTIQVDQIQHNIPVDDAKFVAPPPEPPAAAPKRSTP